MADIVRIVDSIDASPTVLLDLNDEISWWTRSLKAATPRLRRSIAQNSMSDGDRTGAATYGSRVLELVLESRESTQDAAATQAQTLFRLLDMADGKFLQYQPQGASKPVFFVLERSDLSDLSDVMAQAAMRAFTVELKCEPFALGLVESLGSYTVTNNLAAASNGCYFDLAGVIGDVAAPLVLWGDATTEVDHIVGVTHTSTAAPLTWTQAESLTLGTDTTNPGGGPDALMSGTGTNNYVTTSFATETDVAARLTWTVPASATGRHRVLAFVRPSAASGAFSLGLGAVGAAAPDEAVVLTPAVATRMLVDLGVRDFSQGIPESVGYAGVATTKSTQQVSIFAARTSGTATLSWDAIALVPCGGQVGEMGAASLLFTAGITERLVVDTTREHVLGMSVAGDPTAGTGTFDRSGRAAGGFPYVVPGAANRVFVFRLDATRASSVAVTESVSAAYWPRYLFVRPLST